MQDAHAYCEALVREADRDRYLASLFLPEHARRDAFTLFAFNVEVSSVRERAVQPMAGEIRLQWWRDALFGDGGRDIAGNPVASALFESIERGKFPRDKLEALVDARSFDLYDDPMASAQALEGYLRATSSSLFELIAGLLIERQSFPEDAAFHAGMAYGITGLLRAFPLHASRGQIYLPADLLAEHGVLDEDILGGRASAALLDAMAELRGSARKHLEKARVSFADSPSAARLAFLPIALVEPYLRCMERPDYDPFKTPIEVPQWRRQWTLWRAARRGV